jgi:Transposase zinc-binding domain
MVLWSAATPRSSSLGGFSLHSRARARAWQQNSILSAAQRHAMFAIENCRTAALGGHVERCGDCGHQRISYNSCRDRNCPKCQGLARAQWLEDRRAELLDVPYYHVVFTVPAEIEVIAFQNQTVV